MSNVSFLSDISVNPREQNNDVNNLFLLDRLHTSYIELFALTQDFVSRKDVDSKWVDFYAGGVGTTLQQLMAGHSEYDAYEAITARREAYLFEARMQSSAVGIASSMGYSAFRGQNTHLLLTILPDQDTKIEAYSIIGSIGQYDIVALEETSIRYGESIDILVALGTLMQETITIAGAKTHYFRFVSANVSEDVQLRVNNIPVTYSRDILDLLQDEFVTLSNSVGGIDVFYLNRYPPQSWLPNTRYNYFDYILPNYKWRKEFTYTEGQVCTSSDAMSNVYYECVTAGTTGEFEPSWNTEYEALSNDGTVVWKSIGEQTAQRYFKSITPGISESGHIQPVWTLEMNSKVIENDIEWLCTNTFGVSRYPYDTGDKLTLRYIELEDISYSNKDLKLNVGEIQTVVVNSLYSEVEDISSIQVNAPLYHETQKVVRGREDYRKLLKQLIPNIVDANCFDVSPAVVALTYVKDHSGKIWSYNSLIDKGTMLMPTKPNNFIYKALTNGRTVDSQTGISGLVQPEWGGIIGDETVDNQIIWETVAYTSVMSASNWQPETEYTLNVYVKTSPTPSFAYKMVGVNKEPEWPTTLKETVQDNDIIWECSDTIFLDGYEASWYETEKEYEVEDFVKPANPNGYFYRCKVQGKSGIYEPEWPTVVCDTVVDGTVVWECYDLIDSALYQKNVIQTLLPEYRPFGVCPNLLEDPILVNVSFNINLTLNSIVDYVTVDNDIDEILKEYQLILGIGITAYDLENAIEQSLSYIHIARVELLDNTKVKTWEPGMLVKFGDVVEPRVPNGYYYKCQLVTMGSSNYTAWTDRGYSGATEPKWPETPFETINDDYLIWEMRPREELQGTPDMWKADNLYLTESIVSPSNPEAGLYARLMGIRFAEPKWPTTEGASVKDNKIFWICVDPAKTVVPLAWNEYYVFTKNLVITQN